MSGFDLVSDFQPEGAGECLRMVRLANPALGELGPLTWQAGFQVVDYNWRPWLEEIFARQLLPLLGEARDLAASGRSRELVELDRDALPELAPALRESSRRAGRLLLRHGVPVGAKVLQKIVVAVEKEEAAGHLATIFAARCGIFSVSPRQMAFAYLYGEVRLGAPDWRDGEIFARLEEARPVIEKWLHAEGGVGIFQGKRAHG